MDDKKICKINIVPWSTLTQECGVMQTNGWRFITWDSAGVHGLWSSSLNQIPAVIISSLAANCNDLFFRLDVALGIWVFSTSFEPLQTVLEAEVLTQVEI